MTQNGIGLKIDMLHGGVVNGVLPEFTQRIGDPVGTDTLEEFANLVYAYAGAGDKRQGVGREDRKGDGQRLRQAASQRPSDIQRRYLEQAARNHGLLRPRADIARRINQTRLAKWFLEKKVSSGIFNRLKNLFGVEDSIDDDTAGNLMLDASSSNGDLFILGAGTETLAFVDTSSGRVLKLRQLPIGNRHSYGWGVDIDQLGGDTAGRIKLVPADDFSTLQNLLDYNGSLPTPFGLAGFTEGMEFMLLHQDFIDSARKTKTSDLANFMLNQGFQLKTGAEAFGGHPSVSSYVWVHPEHKLVSMDTHTGNFHVDSSDSTIPFDIPTRRLTDPEYQSVMKYLSQA